MEPLLIGEHLYFLRVSQRENCVCVCVCTAGCSVRDVEGAGFRVYGLGSRA